MLILNTGGVKVADGLVEREEKNIQTKGVKERKDEVSLSRTETDPTCNSQTWQPHKHFLFLQRTAISPQTLSPEHRKLKRAGQDSLFLQNPASFSRRAVPRAEATAAAWLFPGCVCAPLALSLLITCRLILGCCPTWNCYFPSVR